MNSHILDCEKLKHQFPDVEIKPISKKFFDEYTIAVYFETIHRCGIYRNDFCDLKDVPLHAVESLLETSKIIEWMRSNFPGKDRFRISWNSTYSTMSQHQYYSKNTRRKIKNAPMPCLIVYLRDVEDFDDVLANTALEPVRICGFLTNEHYQQTINASYNTVLRKTLFWNKYNVKITSTKWTWPTSLIEDIYKNYDPSKVKRDNNRIYLSVEDDDMLALSMLSLSYGEDDIKKIEKVELLDV